MIRAPIICAMVIVQIHKKMNMAILQLALVGSRDRSVQGASPQGSRDLRFTRATRTALPGQTVHGKGQHHHNTYAIDANHDSSLARVAELAVSPLGAREMPRNANASLHSACYQRQ